MQTNSELWLDRTLRIGACGTWWAAGTPGGQTLGTLQLDPELMAEPAVRDRVAAVVSAVRAANPSGVLRTTELVYDARRAWLVVATLPKHTLADLLEARPSLPAGAGAGIAVDVAAGLRELHAAGLAHGDLAPATVVLTGAGSATLAEVGVLAAVRDAPTDLARDAAAWAALLRRLARHTAEPETTSLLEAASTAETGDLTSAARRLELRAGELPDFETRDALCTLLSSIEPAAPDDLATLVPGPRTSLESTAAAAASSTSTVEYGPLVRLRLGPGVPDEALLNPRPVDALFKKRRRGIGRVLAWLGLSLLVLGTGAGAAWWFLLR